MRQFLFGSLTVVLLAWGAIVAGEGTWVSAGGQTIELEGHGKNVFFDDDDGFDLSDLADGETRVFGAGDKQVTVSRSGDEATIYRAASAEKGELSVTCLLSSDTCRVITSDDDPEQVVIVVEKRRECVDGEGDCDHLAIEDIAALGGHAIAITKVVECEDGADCIETEVSTGMPHGPHGIVRIDGSDLTKLRPTCRCPA